MHVLITGGAGFIGSYLVRKFLKEGFKVTCIDNFLTGRPENLSEFFGNKRFKFINHDVTQDIYVSEKINLILHFASPASPKDYMELPIQTLKVGAIGTHKMLGLAKRHKAVFVLASTSEVYGDPLVSPQKEDYWGNVNPIGPRGVYDEAKRFAEALAIAYMKVHKIKVKIARIFNTYGPGMREDDGRAIPSFINQAIKNKPITVYGDGSQTRSFCYIDDMIEGIYKLALSKFTGVMNLGNPEEYRIIDIAEKIKKLTKTKSKIVFKPLPVDDPKVRCPDITLAKKVLNWQPKTHLEEGLKKTINYFKYLATKK
ncbi:MAG: SDR family oxidoreductase [bacterium]|nr:SDR family oxidoreductase [bacterium]